MSAIPKEPAASAPDNKSSSGKLSERYSARKSDELVIALAGPIGCGIGMIVNGLKQRLLERSYSDVIHVKLSDFLETAIGDGLVPEWPKQENASARFIRYRRLQEAGKSLRGGTTNPAILAEYAAKQIVLDRRLRDKGETTEGPVIPKKIAYLIDQVKRPEEVELLRAVYRNLFYLVGVTRVKDLRIASLENELIAADEIAELIRIDKAESSDDGQQLDKTLHLADYFIRNDAATVDEKNKTINRFLDLVHSNRSITPTHCEQGMYAAYTAGLRSACLSRQVGAAIASPTGEVIATGCNDVPKARGGLYSSSDRRDMRCVHQDGQQCFNDLHKRKLRDQIAKQIESALAGIERDGKPIKLTSEELAAASNSIYRNTRLKHLIEFSRSVHAEMDAIVSLARLGGRGLLGATLYTTTFPCHSCARHIVAAGITKVYYIEPYEKSLARDLHKDAIEFETEEAEDGNSEKVQFLHFDGVSPRIFNQVFHAVGRKDSEGRFIPIEPRAATKTIAEYLDNYQDFEAKAVENLNLELERLAKRKVVDINNVLRHNPQGPDNQLDKQQ